LVLRKITPSTEWRMGQVARAPVGTDLHHITRDRQSAAADLLLLDIDKFIGHFEEMLGWALRKKGQGKKAC
jgi:hypothetical protein